LRAPSPFFLTVTVIKPGTTVFISADEAVVYCSDPLGLDITPANGYDTEEGSVDIEVGGATRTIGFWKTHLNFTTYVFTNYTGSSIDLDWKTGCTARINRVLIGSAKGGGINRPLPVWEEYVALACLGGRSP
jgi:hypothetical protein